MIRPTRASLTLFLLSILMGCKDDGDPEQTGPLLTITTLAGGVSGNANGTYTKAKFSYPCGVAVGPDGNIYVTDHGNNNIRVITPAGVATTLAGSTRGYHDGPVAEAKFATPVDLAFDKDGNIYVADMGNDKVRKIDTQGNVTTLVSLPLPGTVAVDPSGNVYVSGINFHSIVKVTPDGKTSDFVTRWGKIVSMTCDAAGNLYVLDFEAVPRVKKISTSHEVTTVAGETTGYVDGKAEEAGFGALLGIAVAVDGTIYVSEVNVRDPDETTGYGVIRMISPDGIVSTVAGGGNGSTDGRGLDALFSYPNDIAVSPEGVVYITDYAGGVIKKGILE